MPLVKPTLLCWDGHDAQQTIINSTTESQGIHLSELHIAVSVSLDMRNCYIEKRHTFPASLLCLHQKKKIMEINKYYKATLWFHGNSYRFSGKQRVWCQQQSMTGANRGMCAKWKIHSFIPIQRGKRHWANEIMHVNLYKQCCCDFNLFQ